MNFVMNPILYGVCLCCVTFHHFTIDWELIVSTVESWKVDKYGNVDKTGQLEQFEFHRVFRDESAQIIWINRIHGIV